jgi:hypothetical protein
MLSVLEMAENGLRSAGLENASGRELRFKSRLSTLEIPQ